MASIRCHRRKVWWQSLRHTRIKNCTHVASSNKMQTAILTFFWVSETTATIVTSEPVPDVVGITKNGFKGFGKIMRT